MIAAFENFYKTFPAAGSLEKNPVIPGALEDQNPYVDSTTRRDFALWKHGLQAKPERPVTDRDVKAIRNRVISGQAEEEELVSLFNRLLPERPVIVNKDAGSLQPSDNDYARWTRAERHEFNDTLVIKWHDWRQFCTTIRAREQCEWLRVIEEAFIVAHLSPPSLLDGYDEAKSRLSELISWNLLRNAMTVDYKQATELLSLYGGEPCSMSLGYGKGHSGNGLYAWHADLPGEGAHYLGETDEEAKP